MSTNDPDDYQQQQPAQNQQRGNGGANETPGVGQYTQLQGAAGGGSYSSTANNKTLGNQRKVMVGSGGEQKVATISNYTEKSMLLSSDEECQ